MRILQTITFTGAIAMMIASCSAPKGIVSVDPAKVDQMPLKTTPLAEKDLQRWSHLDLVKDTFPGMRVDSVFA